jgi:hypothetical protein
MRTPPGRHPPHRLLSHRRLLFIHPVISDRLDIRLDILPRHFRRQHVVGVQNKPPAGPAAARFRRTSSRICPGVPYGIICCVPIVPLKESLCPYVLCNASKIMHSG